MSKGFFIDTTRCIACKGCQIACKQWNNLPAEKTRNRGPLQNPSDFSFTTYKLVRMNEDITAGKIFVDGKDITPLPPREPSPRPGRAPRGKNVCDC